MKNEEIKFEQYYEDIFRFLRGLSLDEHLAEELTQETFYRALKSIDSFQGEAEVRVWLCSIAKNLLYSHYKKQKNTVNVDSMDEIYEANEKLFTDLIVNKELALQVHRILHDLKEPYKEIFSLRVFGELAFKNIGELFGRSEHWACITYHRAKEMIQNEMNEKRR